MGGVREQGIQVVVDGGHPGVELVLEVAWQEPDLLTANRHQRPVDRRSPIAPLLDHLLQRRSQCQKGLARSGHAHEGDRRNVRVHEEIQREDLLQVLRFHPEHVAATRDPGRHRLRMGLHDSGQSGLRTGPQNDVLIDQRIHAGQGDLAGVEQLVDGRRRNFELRPALVELVDGHRVCSVVLHPHAQLRSLDAESGVLGDQHGFTSLANQVETRRQNPVIRSSWFEDLGQPIRVDAVQLDTERASPWQRHRLSHPSLP